MSLSNIFIKQRLYSVTLVSDHVAPKQRPPVSWIYASLGPGRRGEKAFASDEHFFFPYVHLIHRFLVFTCGKRDEERRDARQQSLNSRCQKLQRVWN